MKRRGFLSLFGKAAAGAAVAGSMNETAQASPQAASSAPYGIVDTPCKKNLGARKHKTEFIILHTTEGSGTGALASLQSYSKRSSANYLVMENGKICRIHHHGNNSAHAGVTMWNGKTDLNNRSIGIEVAGYHYMGVKGVYEGYQNKDFSPEQIYALRWLITELKRIYTISDENILTHSMVSMVKNKWYPKGATGRKPCGMCFGRAEIRAQLGIRGKPVANPDVVAGRLDMGDKYLYDVLYSPAVMPLYCLWPRDPNADLWVKTRKRADPSKPVYREPPKVIEAKVTGNGHKYTIRQGDTPWKLAGKKSVDKNTYYVFPSNPIVVKNATDVFDKDMKPLVAVPPQTKMLIGYKFATIGAGETAFQYAKKNWNSPLTIYITPAGLEFEGDEVDPNSLLEGTTIFYF